METINAKEYNNTPALSEEVAPDNDLKNILVEYVGELYNPEDKNVTVEMIVEAVAKDFPEFILALAEENFFRGYHQGIQDINSGMDKFAKLSEQVKNIEKIGLDSYRELYKNELKYEEKRKSCKLCEKQE